MVVATEFYDRRPRREPVPARRLSLPRVEFTLSTPRKEVELEMDLTPEPEPVSETPQPFTSWTEEYISLSEGKTTDVVSAWRSIEEAYNTLRVRVMRTTGCSLQQAEELLRHMPGFYHLHRAACIAERILQKPVRLWSESEYKQINKALQYGERALWQFSQQLDAFELNPERLQKMTQSVSNTDTVLGDHETVHKQWCRELMERRAMLRSVVMRAAHKLKKLSSHTEQEKRMVFLLQRFAPLEDFPNIIKTEEDAIALQKVLKELEPAFATLEPLLSRIRDDEQGATQFAQDLADDSALTGASATGTELGIYTVAWGETMEDILLGDTAATDLPILLQLSVSAKQKVIDEALEVLNASPALCAWIGLPYPASELLNEVAEGHVLTVNLDKLHDLVTLIAGDQGVINLPARAQRSLAQLMVRVIHTHDTDEVADAEAVFDSEIRTVQSLDDLWPALCSYMGRTATKETSARVSEKRL